jgi:hypothetical protein
VTSQTIVNRAARRSSSLGPSGRRAIAFPSTAFAGVFITSPAGRMNRGISGPAAEGAMVAALIAVRTRRVATWRGTVICSPAG